MPFVVPMFWRVRSNHNIDCYICMVPSIQNGVSMKKQSTLVYPNIPSAIRPMPHGGGLPVPEPLDNFDMCSDDEDSVSSNSKEKQPSASRDATICQAQTPPIIKSRKARSVTSSGILNFQKIRQNFRHQAYNSGIFYTTEGNGVVPC